MKWSERSISRALALQFFQRKSVVLVPNCNWTGSECDLLVVQRDLRIIDVEIKISRADLKADAKKDKWWHHLTYAEKEAAGLDPQNDEWWSARRPTQWPRKVWKHYYALPSEIWKQELIDSLPSKYSGVLLLSMQSNGVLAVHCERRATPNKDAKKISAEQAIDIARLANLRMWESYQQLDQLRSAA